MPELIHFREALRRSTGQQRALLLGNGFSANYFNYRSLLDMSELVEDSSVWNVFSALGTADFEAVIRALEGAVLVEQAYKNNIHADQLISDAQEVRKALVKAINVTHPAHRLDIGSKYTYSAAFLDHFSMVFSLNYDLLLYWVALENGRLTDGFGYGRTVGSFRGPFNSLSPCNLYNLHGGLHLFETIGGELEKAVDTGSGVIATITSAIERERRLPLYVAEGTSSQKMHKINSSAYLRFCYDILSWNSEVIFVYGHSADDNDAHIYRAIFNDTGKREHLYFGIYKQDTEKLRTLDGILAKYQKTAGSSLAYTFFYSESANVWGTDDGIETFVKGSNIFRNFN